MLKFNHSPREASYILERYLLKNFKPVDLQNIDNAISGYMGAYEGRIISELKYDISIYKLELSKELYSLFQVY